MLNDKEMCDKCKEIITKKLAGLEEVINEYLCKIDDDAKGIYIGEEGVEWSDKHNEELAKSIQEYLMGREK